MLRKKLLRKSLENTKEEQKLVKTISISSHYDLFSFLSMCVLNKKSYLYRRIRKTKNNIRADDIFLHVYLRNFLIIFRVNWGAP
jgi:hypothetical protein